MFEDYNYNMFNKYVLVNPNKEYTEYSYVGEDQSEHPGDDAKSSKGLGGGGGDDVAGE